MYCCKKNEIFVGVFIQKMDIVNLIVQDMNKVVSYFCRLIIWSFIVRFETWNLFLWFVFMMDDLWVYKFHWWKEFCLLIFLITLVLFAPFWCGGKTMTFDIQLWSVLKLIYFYFSGKYFVKYLVFFFVIVVFLYFNVMYVLIF